MKKILTILILLLNLNGYSQKKLFYAYADSAILVQDANKVVADFTTRVNAMIPAFASRPVAVLNTKPFLIFYSSKANKVNLPIWHQVIDVQKKFFAELSGSEKEGKKMFGFFFNGFYLPHELGHALQHAAKKSEPDLYQNEYVANEIAILYWRKVKRTKELKKCYQYARKI